MIVDYKHDPGSFTEAHFEAVFRRWYGGSVEESILRQR